MWQVNGVTSPSAPVLLLLLPSVGGAVPDGATGAGAATGSVQPPSTTAAAPPLRARRKGSPSLSSSRSAARFVLDAEYADFFQLRS